MKFAINFSQQAADLIQNGKIEIDLFKTPDWPELIAQAAELRRVSVHFDTHVPFPTDSRPDWSRVAGLLDQTGTPYVNAHFAPRMRDFDDKYPFEAALVTQTRMIEAAVQDLKEIIAQFGAQKVILENYPYHAQEEKWSRRGAHPDLMRIIVDQCGCGFLLDISHARISADGIGMDEYEYLELLPVDALRELHFTGIQNLDGRLTDHLSVLDSDWPVLEWVLDHIKSGDWPPAWMLAFEYGGVGERFTHRSDAKVISEQVPRLYELVQAV